MTTTTTILGEGRLSWPRGERVSDRYGSVLLIADGDPPAEPYVHFDADLDGKRGELVATVLATRQSAHIGDLFRGLSPQTPQVGDEIRLGAGTVFIDDIDGIPTIGLHPDDGRTSDWLDPTALYRAHEQTVRLSFVAGAA